MHNPLVSVVIPTYNHACFLKEALESVIKQTYSNWEIIVVNNYSEDETIEVVEHFADSRIQLINFRNQGVIGASRNVGIAASRGQYVAFLDSDDRWFPDKLLASVERLQLGFDLVCHSQIYRYENGSQKRVSYGPEYNANYSRLLFHNNCIATSATVVCKTVLEKLGGFSEAAELITVEDYDLWLRIAKANYKIGFLDETLGEYRVHSGGASKRLLKHMHATLTVISEHYHEGIKQTVWNRLKFQNRCSRVMSSIAWQMSDVENRSDALHTIGRALRSWPFNYRAYGMFFIISGTNVLNR